jgi:hypothetical protein
VVWRGPPRGGKIKFSKASKTMFLTAPHSRSDEIERLISDKYNWVDEGFKLRSKSGPESPEWVFWCEREDFFFFENCLEKWYGTIYLPKLFLSNILPVGKLCDHLTGPKTSLG